MKTKDADGQPMTVERKVTATRWTFVIGKDGKIVYKNSPGCPGQGRQGCRGPDRKTGEAVRLLPHRRLFAVQAQRQALGAAARLEELVQLHRDRRVARTPAGPPPACSQPAFSTTVLPTTTALQPKRFASSSSAAISRGMCVCSTLRP